MNEQLIALASEWVRYRANVASLAKGGFTIDATVEMQVGSTSGFASAATETDVLARLRSFVGKLRAEYPAQVEVK